MALYIYAPPIKATVAVNLESLFGQAAKSKEAREILKELTQVRQNLLKKISSLETPVTEIEELYKSYVSLQLGFVQAEEVKSESKTSSLRNVVKYTWSNALGNTKIVSESDARFDLASMSENVALWYLQIAAKTVNNTSVEENVAKQVFHQLKTAASLFEFVEKQYSFSAITDLSPDVLAAYKLQCIAEAQEISVLRAQEQKHKPTLIAALCADIEAKYSAAGAKLGQLDRSLKLKNYYIFKGKLYKALSLALHGQSQLTSDECGKAIRTLQEAEKLLRDVEAAAKAYNKEKGGADLLKHPFLHACTMLVTETATKCKRENDFIYFQKVPVDFNEVIEGKSVVQLADYEVPALSPLWTADARAGFDPFLAPVADQKQHGEAVAALEKQEEAKDAKEATHGNSSCTIL
eukprot:Colp12_sorted_trinity150504_noHs@4062